MNFLAAVFQEGLAWKVPKKRPCVTKHLENARRIWSIGLLNSLLKNATFTTGWWRCQATLFYLDLKNTSSHAPQGRKTHVKKQFRGAYGAPCRSRCREDPGSEGRRGQNSPNTQGPKNLKMSYAPYLCHSQWPMELSSSWSVPGNAGGKCTVNRLKTQEPSVMLMWGFS